MLAVIQTGGKQYLVQEGSILKIEKIEGNPGDQIELKDVLLVSDEEGEKFFLGQPIISKAKIEAEILKQGKGEKVEIVKYKPKVRYRRHRGHRQLFTEIKVKKIIYE